MTTTSTSLIVGRERERAQLQHLLDAALAGQGRLALVSGEAGIGKTALVNEMVANARDPGCLVLPGGCYDLTTTPPYGPWAEAIRAYPSGSPDLPDLPAQLREGTGLEGITSQAELFNVIMDFLVSVAASRPLVIVLEDLHWSDTASIELLRFVGRKLSGSAMLIVATYRDDEITRRHPLFQRLPLIVREAGAERIDLIRLKLPELRQLVQVRYALPSSDGERLAAYVLDRAEGNLLFTNELLRSIERAGVLAQQEDGWELGSLSGVETSPLLIQMIERQLAPLAPATREALEIAAIIGQDVPFGTWKSVSNLDEEALDPIIEQATELHALTTVEDSSRMRFSHALVREALYNGLTPPRRRIWHRRVAEALINEPHPDPDMIAYHFQQVGDPRAVEWLVRAGVRAERRYSLMAAAHSYDAAQARLEDDAAQLQLRGWLMLRIGCLLRYSDEKQALAYLEDASALGTTAGDDVLTVHCLCTRGLLHCFSGVLLRGVAEMEAGVALFDALSSADQIRVDTPLTTLVGEAFTDQHKLPGGLPMPGILPGVNHRKNATIAWISLVGRFTEALAMGEAFVAQVTAEAPNEAVVQDFCHDAYNGLGVATAMLGDPNAAWHWFSLALDAHRARGHRVQIAVVLEVELRLVNISYQSDRVAERARLLEELTETVMGIGDAFGFDVLIMRGLVNLRVDILEGRWSRARDAAIAGLAPSIPFGWKVWAMHDRATLARHQGDPEEAWRQVHALVPDGLDTEWGSQVFEYTSEAQRLAAELSLDANDLEQASAWLDMHDCWLELSGAVLGRSVGHLLRARYHQIAGEPALAREHADQALERASDPRQPLALIAAHRFLGELELNARHYAAAAEHLRASLDLSIRCMAPFEQTQTLLVQAELAAHTGQRDAALRLLGDARAICEPLEARPTLARIDELERRLRHQPTGHPAGLSDREVEVLEHAATGATNAEIGDALFISPRTVAQHLRSVYNKLGVNSRAAAVARWAELARNEAAVDD